MCKPDKPDPPPPPPPAPTFMDDFAATSADVENDRRKALFAGLSKTIRGSASGILGTSATTTGRK